MRTSRFGALDSRHRARLAEILAATEAFSADELAVALELFDAAFSAGAGEPGSGVATSPPAYEFLGLFDGETLAGYACFGPTPGTDGTFDLYWIAVHPAAQGAGAGALLLAEVERRLRERGGRLIVAETSSRAAYARTRRFYDGRGYREVARVAAFYAPADDRVIYAKRLSRADAAAGVRSTSTH